MSDLFPSRAATGMEPRERVRMGTYLTIIDDQIRLQHEYPGDTFFVIADYHALARGSRTANIREQSREMAVTYLALGADADKAVLYRQSDVPELFEMLWILACFAPPSLLPTTSGSLVGLPWTSANIASAIYPLLMAADALGLRATTAAVAPFDIERIEYARELASRLNAHFGEVLFPVPQYRITSSVDGWFRNDEFADLAQGPSVFAEEGEIALWISAVAAHAQRPNGPKDLWTRTMELYRLVVGVERYSAALAQHSEVVPADDWWRDEIVAGFCEHVTPFREASRRLAYVPEAVEGLLRKGAERARAEFTETLALLRERIGLDR